MAAGARIDARSRSDHARGAAELPSAKRSDARVSLEPAQVG